MHDKGKRHNSDLLEAIELGFLLSGPKSPGQRAQPQGIWPRPRGLPNRDDTNYMRHTMAHKEGRDLLSDIRLDYKPVVRPRYEPMERKY